MANLQPTSPIWYPKPDDVVVWDEISRELPSIGTILSIETDTANKPVAWVDSFHLGARTIEYDRLTVVTNPDVIEAYRRTTEAIKALEALLQNG